MRTGVPRVLTSQVKLLAQLLTKWIDWGTAENRNWGQASYGKTTDPLELLGRPISSSFFFFFFFFNVYLFVLGERERESE